MSQANDLLDTLDEGTRIAPNNGAEPHIVVNADRTISVPDELINIAVQYDHNIETVTFDCLRYWDEHDFSTMKAYINYVRADGYKDIYEVKNLRIDDEDDSILHFEWTISRNVTSVPGKISFLICIKDDDNEPHWNSHINSEMVVSPGMEFDPQNLSPDAANLFVATLPQNLTPEQQKNALKNIGAASEEINDIIVTTTAKDTLICDSACLKDIFYYSEFSGSAHLPFYRISQSVVTADDITDSITVVLRCSDGEDHTAIVDNVSFNDDGYAHISPEIFDDDSGWSKEFADIHFVPTDNYRLDSDGEIYVFPTKGIWEGSTWGLTKPVSITIPGFEFVDKKFDERLIPSAKDADYVSRHEFFEDELNTDTIYWDLYSKTGDGSDPLGVGYPGYNIASPFYDFVNDKFEVYVYEFEYIKLEPNEVRKDDDSIIEVFDDFAVSWSRSDGLMIHPKADTDWLYVAIRTPGELTFSKKAIKTDLIPDPATFGAVGFKEQLLNASAKATARSNIGTGFAYNLTETATDYTNLEYAKALDYIKNNWNKEPMNITINGHPVVSVDTSEQIFYVLDGRTLIKYSWWYILSTGRVSISARKSITLADENLVDLNFYNLRKSIVTEYGSPDTLTFAYKEGATVVKHDFEFGDGFVSTIRYVHVSDIVFGMNNIPESSAFDSTTDEFAIRIDSDAGTVHVPKDMIELLDPFGAMTIENYVMVIPEKSVGTEFTIGDDMNNAVLTFPKPGIYFQRGDFYNETRSLTIPGYTGFYTKKLKPELLPTPEEIGAASAEEVGNVATALDAIIAIQEALIGGDSV